jgi:hypothetical protein
MSLAAPACLDCCGTGLVLQFAYVPVFWARWCIRITACPVMRPCPTCQRAA